MSTHSAGFRLFSPVFTCFHIRYIAKNGKAGCENRLADPWWTDAAPLEEPCHLQPTAGAPVGFLDAVKPSPDLLQSQHGCCFSGGSGFR